MNQYDQCVRDEMSRVVITAGLDDSVLDALLQMKQSGVNVLPLVDAEDRYVGMFSTSDLANVTDGLTHQVKKLEHVSDTSRQWLIERIIASKVGSKRLGEIATGKILRPAQMY